MNRYCFKKFTTKFEIKILVYFEEQMQNYFSNRFIRLSSSDAEIDFLQLFINFPKCFL